MFNIKKAPSLKAALDWIRGWEYYDNEQHGMWTDENDLNYGPILVYNSSVHYFVKMDSSTEFREIDRWVDEPVTHREVEPIFHGDLSPRRIRVLMVIAKMFQGRVVIEFEHRHPTNVDVAYEYSFVDGRGELTGRSGMLATLERYYPKISEELLGVDTNLEEEERKVKMEEEERKKRGREETIKMWRESPDLCDDCGETLAMHTEKKDGLTALFPGCEKFVKGAK